MKAKQTKTHFACNQCQAAMIQGVFCHETGCPNANKTWIPDREQWVRFVECRECDSEVEVGESCANCEENARAYQEECGNAISQQ